MLLRSPLLFAHRLALSKAVGAQAVGAQAVGAATPIFSAYAQPGVTR